MMAENPLLPSGGDESVHPAQSGLYLFRSDDLVQVYALVEKGLTIGKAPTNEVVVQHDYASRLHARIVAQRGGWLLEDAGSTNGTFVYQDDSIVYSSAIDPVPWLLSDGQEIRLGPHPTAWRLIFRNPTTTARSPTLFIDKKQRQVWVRGRPVKLPRDHYTVLLHLYREAPYPCSYDALCEAIEQDRREREKTASAQFSEPNLVSLHQLIHRLRSRIELDPKHPTLLIQVPQFGYRLRRNG